jgi:hypothetical protein
MRVDAGFDGSSDAACDSGAVGVGCLALATPGGAIYSITVDDENVYVAQQWWPGQAADGPPLLAVSRVTQAVSTIASSFPLSPLSLTKDDAAL